MKKTYIFWFFILTFYACDSKKNITIDNPSKIGPFLFEFLQNFPNQKISDYTSIHLSYSEMAEISNYYARNERYDLSRLLPEEEEWIKDITDSFNSNKKSAARSGIVWSEVKYLDFIYEEKEISYKKKYDNIEKIIDEFASIKRYTSFANHMIYEGELFLKYNNDEFYVDFVILNYKSKYKFLLIDV